MKKTLLLTLALLFSTTIFAQVLIDEKFDSSEWPEGWTITGEAIKNWSISNTNNAGGEANEAKLGWSPQFNGISRLVAAPINLTNIQSLIVKFDHYLDNYADGFSTIGIATSSDGGTSWNIGWSCEYNEEIKYSIEQRIATSDMGKDNVLICIYFEGVSARFQAWYFDNIVVAAQPDTEVRLNSIDIYERIGSGPLDVKFSVQNMGNDDIQSLVASYELEGYETVTEAFSASIESFGTATFSFTDKKNILPGTYNIKINILSINGSEDNTDDNVLSKEFNASLGEKQRIPMIEHFSSSTCAPCVLINQLMEKLTTNNPDKFTYTKYVVHWPGIGDPYFISDNYDKCLFYNVSTVPQVFLDTELQISGNTAQPVTQTKLLQRYDVPAFAEIRGSFNVNHEDNTISLIADVASYVNLNDVRTFITINEKTTTENTVEYGGNGESEFHHVMMKMIGGSNGIETSIKAGKYKRFEYTCDMSTTFMEDLNDLEVAVWIQDIKTKEIFNSHYLYEYTDHPYPVKNINITAGNRLKIEWDAPEKGNPTGYNLYINNELILNNTPNTSFTIDLTDYCIVEVVALYENNKTSVGKVKTYPSDNDDEDDEEKIDEIADNKINIHPNPTNDRLYIEAETKIEEIAVYDVYGRRLQSIVNNQQSLSIDVADLKSGIYFIKINTNKGNIVKRIIKN